MGRGINKAIPQDTRDWPMYEHKEYPKIIGHDAAGKSITAGSLAEENALRATHPDLMPKQTAAPEPKSDEAPVENNEAQPQGFTPQPAPKPRGR